MEKESEAKLIKLGVKMVTVDKSGFEKIAAPIQDELAKKLGPHAEKILALVRNVK
jgi:TRAP-type C4-dicarboxylate transport system substrate-binding protein